MPAQNFDLFTIGHSNHAIDRFVALLKGAGITAIADVRSIPSSRRYPWFAKERLRERLAAEGIEYVPMGDALGGRPQEPELFRDGIADYEAMAATQAFRGGIDRVIEGTRRFRVCLMCAEREPLDCHRCLLVAPALAARGQNIGHILGDGAVTPHREIEERLLAAAGDDLFGDSREARLTAAIRKAARGAAFRSR